MTIALHPADSLQAPLQPPAELTIESITDVNQIAPLTPETDPPPVLTAPSVPLVETTSIERHRYFNVAEVDRPAMPRPDWQVDVALLIGMGVRSFSVDVLIDDTGAAEHCAVTRIEPDQALELRQAVAAKLCETTLSPAMRHGVAVHSVRHIELLLERY